MPVLRVFSDEKLVDQCDVMTDRISIGRSTDNDLVLNRNGVSKHHAVIEKQGAHYVLIDVGSSNGTFIDNQRIERVRLAFWTEIHIAGFVLKFMGNQRHLEQDDDLLNERDGLLPSDQTMVMSPEMVSEWLEPKPRRVKPLFLPVANAQTIKARFEMDSPEAYIGKASDCDIRVGGFFSPGKAAHLIWDGNKVFVESASFCSIRVNRKKVKTKIQLRNGDRLRVNSTEMEFQHLPD